jgi:beta-phosphoglucomutase-like phosphatase (HAD superfamily)
VHLPDRRLPFTASFTRVRSVGGAWDHESTSGGIVPDTPDLVILDLPCLVTPDPGTAPRALDRALGRLGIDPGSRLHDDAMTCSLRWPGEAARAALSVVLGSDAWGDAAEAAFDDAFGGLLARQGAVLVDGAAAATNQLLAHGARLCLTTEFSAATRDAILDVLEWPGLIALLLSPDLDVSDPDDSSLVVAALLRSGVNGCNAMVVSGSVTGVAAGRRAGARRVVGIVGPDGSAAELMGNGATEVTGLPQLACELSDLSLISA